MATLEEFLRTGQIGPIHPGMTQAGAIAALGPPSDESIRREPKILKYGPLELTFTRRQAENDSVLALIALYFGRPAEPIPEAVRPTDFPGTADGTVAGIRGFLNRVGLKESACKGDDQTSYLVMPSGAHITFDGPQLHSILFTVRTPTPHKKQISVSIPEDAWQQLSALARQTNRSVAELCAQWITQRAGAEPGS